MVYLGPLFIICTFALNALKIEPFATFFYLCAWSGLIFFFDQLIRRREGRSLIARCGLGGFASMMLWSAAFWYFFELLNFRLQNWYYIFVVDHTALRTVFGILSFATVFPGILWIEYYLRLRGIAAGAQGFRLHFPRSALYGLQLLGILFLVLPMLWPRYFFPLVWGAVALFLAPIHYRRGIDGLLRQWERGQWGPLLRTLLAGLIAGLLWESLNYWARAKWIYTVPFFEELKLFEMPLLGFLGFPPFALECVVFYRWLVYQRLAPALGDYAEQRAEPRSPAVRNLALMLACAGMLIIDRFEYLSTGSITPVVEDAIAIESNTKAVLAARDVRYLTELQGWVGQRHWRALEGALSDEEYAHLERVVSLYLHEGIGVESGNALWRSGIHSLQALGQLDEHQIRARMAATADLPHLPPAARVRVWLRRAKGAH